MTKQFFSSCNIDWELGPLVLKILRRLIVELLRRHDNFAFKLGLLPSWLFLLLCLLLLRYLICSRIVTARFEQVPSNVSLFLLFRCSSLFLELSLFLFSKLLLLCLHLSLHQLFLFLNLSFFLFFLSFSFIHLSL